MTTSSSIHRLGSARAKVLVPSTVRRRSRASLSAALTGCAVAIGALLAALFGAEALALFAIALPVPLVLLWLSSDVYRSDEQ